MAYDDSESNWTDEERYYSSERSSDDSPILSKNKRRGYTRRSALTVLAKFFLFSSAMIIVCVLMYIPVYRRVRYPSKAMVAGWSVDAIRDTKVYIRPNNYTVLHEPKNICSKDGKKLFLLIVVISATSHTQIRNSIRKTYGNYNKYQKINKIYHEVVNEHKNCFHYNNSELNIVDNCNKTEKPREIRGFKDLLPELAKSLKDKLKNYNHKESPSIIETFNMNKELGEVITTDYNDYEYDTNVMKIPAEDDGTESNQMDKILNALNQVYDKDIDIDNTEDPDFKLVFLLGKPVYHNGTIHEEVQNKIDEEINEFDDIIQEDFIDTYNNLTLKSIMMLKWVSRNCYNSVRYIIKVDDDVYLHIPHLVDILHNYSNNFDQQLARNPKAKEYLLLGTLYAGARPIKDFRNKWYSPNYMYPGKFYPNYLSGTGYIMSYDAATVIYKAALETALFHLEDVFITGICPLRASIPIPLRGHPALLPQHAITPCAAHESVKAIFSKSVSLEAIEVALLDKRIVSKCEKQRIIKVRNKLRNAKLKLQNKKRHNQVNRFKSQLLF